MVLAQHYLRFGLRSRAWAPATPLPSTLYQPTSRLVDRCVRDGHCVSFVCLVFQFNVFRKKNGHRLRFISIDQSWSFSPIDDRPCRNKPFAEALSGFDRLVAFDIWFQWRKEHSKREGRTFASPAAKPNIFTFRFAFVWYLTDPEWNWIDNRTVLVALHRTIHTQEPNASQQFTRLNSGGRNPQNNSADSIRRTIRPTSYSNVLCRNTRETQSLAYNAHETCLV